MFSDAAFTPDAASLNTTPEHAPTSVTSVRSQRSIAVRNIMYLIFQRERVKRTTRAPRHVFASLCAISDLCVAVRSERSITDRTSATASRFPSSHFLPRTWTHLAALLVALDGEVWTEEEVGDGEQQRFRQWPSFVIAVAIGVQTLEDRETRSKRCHMTHLPFLTLQHKEPTHIQTVKVECMELP